jgi:hypothetical protein
MRMILELVTVETCGMPWLSLKMMPICDGVMPFLAIFAIMSLISSGVVLHQSGADRLKGMDDLDIPFPLLCMRPMFAYLFCFKVRNKREKDVSIPRKRKEEDASKEKTGLLSPSLKKPHRRRREISFAREEVNARVHVKKTREYRKHRIQNDAKSRSSIRFYLRIEPSPPLKKTIFFPRVKRERRKEISPSHKNSQNERGREVNAAQIPPAFEAIHSRSRKITLVHERERAEGHGGSDFKKHTKPRVPFLRGQKFYEEAEERKKKKKQRAKVKKRQNPK